MCPFHKTVQGKSQTLNNSRIEKPLTSRYCDNAIVILGVIILMLLMMKIASTEVKQLYPVSKLTKRQEARSRAKSVQCQNSYS